MSTATQWDLEEISEETARFGAEGGEGGGGAEGGGGGGGGDMISGIIMAITMAVKVGGDFVRQGRMDEIDPGVWMPEVPDQLSQTMTAIRRIKGEIADYRQARNAHSKWLTKASNIRLKSGQSDAFCNPNWTDDGAWTGAHGEFLHNCAYWNPAAANDQKNQFHWRQEDIEAATYTRGPARDNISQMLDQSSWAHKGNLADYREVGRGLHTSLLTLVLFAPLFRMAYGFEPRIQFGPEDYLSKAWLSELYPDAAKWPLVHERGVLPFSLRDEMIRQLELTAAAGQIQPNYPIPYWLFGYTPEDRVGSGSLPRLDQLVALQRAYANRAMLGLMNPNAESEGDTFSGLGAMSPMVTFGATETPAPSNFYSWFRALHASGRVGEAVYAGETGHLPLPPEAPEPPPAGDEDLGATADTTEKELAEASPSGLVAGFNKLVWGVPFPDEAYREANRGALVSRVVSGTAWYGTFLGLFGAGVRAALKR